MVVAKECTRKPREKRQSQDIVQGKAQQRLIIESDTSFLIGNLPLQSIKMERVLYNLHSNVCSIGLRRTSSKTRSAAEHCLLLVALCGFGVLIISHLSFVHRSSSSIMEKQPQRKSIPLQCLSSIQGFQNNAHVTHVVLWERDESLAYSVRLNDEDKNGLMLDCPLNNTEPTCSDATNDKNRVCQQTSSQQHSSMSCPSVSLQEQQQDITLSYSPTRGFLFLPLSTSLQHNVSTQFVFVSKQNVQCFGEPFLQLLVKHLLGVETVAFHWLLAQSNHTGYIYNPKTREVTDLHASSGQYSLWNSSASNRNKSGKHALLFKAGVILTSVFLFFITTTLVSFTLRETQERMLHFTFQLQLYVEQDRRLGSLITTHVVENLVFVPIMIGNMFFLIEFYGGDKLLAFMVMSIVWVCEVFSIVAIRSIQGMQFFPKIFFLLFTLFHVYFFSCPFGFSYLALASTSIFMIHSMYFFWHRYELPAVAHGLVSIDNPRMGISVAPSEMDRIMVPLLPPNTSEEEQQQQQHRLHLPPRNPILRGQSHLSMTSLGRNSTASRAHSSTGLPFHGDDDGDGSESYMYFMNGEVVMHRERNARGRSPSISTHGSMDHNETSSLNGTSPEPVNDNNNTVPRIVAPPGSIVQTSSTTSEITAPEAAEAAAASLPVPPAASLPVPPVATIQQDETPPNRSDSPLRQPQQDAAAAQQVDTDLTPRIGSASSREIDPSEGNGPVPMFPVGIFRQSNKR